MREDRREKREERGERREERRQDRMTNQINKMHCLTFHNMRRHIYFVRFSCTEKKRKKSLFEQNSFVFTPQTLKLLINEEFLLHYQSPTLIFHLKKSFIFQSFTLEHFSHSVSFIYFSFENIFFNWSYYYSFTFHL